MIKCPICFGGVSNLSPCEVCRGSGNLETVINICTECKERPKLTNQQGIHILECKCEFKYAHHTLKRVINDWNYGPGLASSLQDSGNRTASVTGGLRDMPGGKGAYHLLSPIAIDRLAKHYENGAKKYSERNWEKGLPLKSFIDSALRHIFQILAGDDSEDHAAAFTWNGCGFIHTESKIKSGQLPMSLVEGMPQEYINKHFPTRVVELNFYKGSLGKPFTRKDDLELDQATAKKAAEAVAKIIDDQIVKEAKNFTIDFRVYLDKLLKSFCPKCGSPHLDIIYGGISNILQFRCRGCKYEASVIELKENA